MIADMLRRAHLHDGVPWSSMAVLVRSATRQVPLLRRALADGRRPGRRRRATSCRWPPSRARGRCSPLLRCALQPGALDEDAAAELLTGPLGGTDALGLRRLRRALRAAATGAGRGAGRNEPLASALRDPRELDPARRARAPTRPGGWPGLLALAAATPPSDGTAHDVLWAVWDASGLARRGRRRARPAGPAAPPPTGIWTRWWPCSTPRPGSPSPAAARVALAVPGQPGRPGDPRRHAGRPGAGRRGGPHPHRAPLQGTGMGPGRGRRRAGGHLARPAAAVLAAGHGRTGRRGGRPGRSGPPGPDAAAAALVVQAARRGTPAVLRRGDPGPAGRWWSPRPAGRTARTGRPGSWPSWPATTIEIEHGRRGRAALAVAARADRRPAPGRRRPRGRPRAVRAAAAAQLARLAAGRGPRRRTRGSGTR